MVVSLHFFDNVRHSNSRLMPAFSANLMMPAQQSAIKHNAAQNHLHQFPARHQLVSEKGGGEYEQINTPVHPKGEEFASYHAGETELDCE